jgi:hypothetical protein
MDTPTRDVRFALRRLGQAPGFTVFAVVSLALGIGVSTAIYSAVRTLLWMPMGIAQPERAVAWMRMGRAQATMSWPDFVDLRSQQGSFMTVAAARMRSAPFAAGALADTVLAEGVSGEYFETLGLTPLRGRLLQRADEDRAARVAVVSERFWRTRLAADPSIVNHVVKIGGEPFELVGIVRDRSTACRRSCPSPCGFLRRRRRTKPGPELPRVSARTGRCRSTRSGPV